MNIMNNCKNNFKHPKLVTCRCLKLRCVCTKTKAYTITGTCYIDNLRKKNIKAATCIPNVLGIKIGDNSIDEVITHDDGTNRFPVACILSKQQANGF